MGHLCLCRWRNKLQEQFRWYEKIFLKSHDLHEVTSILKSPYSLQIYFEHLKTKKKKSIGIRGLWWSWPLMHESTYFIIDLSICASIVLNENIFLEREIGFPETSWSWPKLPTVFGCISLFDFFNCILYRAKNAVYEILGVARWKKGKSKNNVRPVILPVFHSCVTAGIHVAAHYTLHIYQKQTHPKPQIQGKKYNKGKGHFYSFSSIIFLLQWTHDKFIPQ